MGNQHLLTTFGMTLKEDNRLGLHFRVSPQQLYENITFLVDECFCLLSSIFLFFRFIDQFQKI
jgi:hypothetical protein